jgi:hypothetical protein
MLIEVVLHIGEVDFARKPRCFCMHIEVILDLHASRGRMDCTNQRQIWELCQEGHSKSSSEIYRVYT